MAVNVVFMVLKQTIPQLVCPLLCLIQQRQKQKIHSFFKTEKCVFVDLNQLSGSDLPPI